MLGSETLEEQSQCAAMESLCLVRTAAPLMLRGLRTQRRGFVIADWLLTLKCHWSGQYGEGKIEQGSRQVNVSHGSERTRMGPFGSCRKLERPIKEIRKWLSHWKTTSDTSSARSG